MNVLRSRRVAKGTNPRAVVLQRMKELGWTPYKLAAAVKVPRTTVYEWLSGKREIRADNLEPIFQALGIKMSSE